MLEERAYCPDRRRHVRVARRDAARRDGHACLRDEPYFPLCLQFGAGCTAERCGAVGVPRALMAAELARHGLARGRLPSLRATCGACGRFAELSMIDPRVALCSVCGGIASPA